MTRSQLTCGLAAALLAGSGGAYAAPPGLLRSAGEAQAHSYFISHRIEFAPQITEITPEQRDAALVEGWHERADASHAFRDGGGWILPAALIPPKEAAWTERGRQSPASHGPAGEARARVYYFNHRVEFAPQITEITPEQRDAALVEGWHERADVSRAFRDGGGWILPAALIPPKEAAWTERGRQSPASHGPAGEARARVYYFNHRVEFAPQITEITPEQRDAALVEGWHERADVSRAFRDGGGWTLPAAFIPLKQNVWTEPAPAVRRPDGGRWLLPEELIRPDR